jgi:type II secretory pathway component PulF
MIAVGEESAELESALMTVAETYDVEVETSVKALISMLEPTIIITLAVIFGFIIVSMLLPVFQMNLFPAQ